MILTDCERRWQEVRLYHMIMDVYKIRNKMIDIVDVTEIVCGLGNIKTSVMKRVINKMMDDSYYRPYKTEIVYLAKLQGYTDLQVGRYMGTTRQAVFKLCKENLKNYVPVPRFEIDEDCEIKKFLETFETLKKVGI